MTRIREFEFSLVRIEEAEKYKIKMEEYREELERIHLERLNKLRVREKETIDKCNERLRFIETANHDHRQKILKDFEMLKMREDDLDKTRMLFEEVFFHIFSLLIMVFLIKRVQNWKKPSWSIWKRNIKGKFRNWMI